MVRIFVRLLIASILAAAAAPPAGATWSIVIADCESGEGNRRLLGQSLVIWQRRPTGS